MTSSNSNTFFFLSQFSDLYLHHVSLGVLSPSGSISRRGYYWEVIKQRAFWNQGEGWCEFMYEMLIPEWGKWVRTLESLTKAHVVQHIILCLIRAFSIWSPILEKWPFHSGNMGPLFSLPPLLISWSQHLKRVLFWWWSGVAEAPLRLPIKPPFFIKESVSAWGWWGFWLLHIHSHSLYIQYRFLFLALMLIASSYSICRRMKLKEASPYARTKGSQRRSEICVWLDNIDLGFVLTLGVNYFIEEVAGVLFL